MPTDVTGRLLRALFSVAALTALAGCNDRLPRLTAPSSLDPRREAATLAAQEPGSRPPRLADGDESLQDRPRAQFFLNTPPADPGRPALAEAQPPGGSATVTLNFINADIREVVRAVLGEILKAPYSIDARVQGNLTLQTNGPIDRETVLPVLEDALRLSGLAMVSSGNLLNIVPLNEASRFASFGDGGKTAAAGFSVQVIALRYTQADEILNIVRQVVPPETGIQAVASRNVLIASGSKRDVDNVKDLVASFDTDMSRGMSFALLYPQQTNAKALAKDLESVFEQQPNARGLVRFTAIERINAILAVSRTPSYLREASVWVERLDQSSAAVDERLFVYYVQNRRAADLASNLTAIFGRRNADASSAVATGTRDSGVTNGVLTSASLRGDQPGLVAVSTGADDGIRLSGTRPPQITADEKNNAILTLATPKDYRVIEAAISKLDLVPLQVLIEAVVVEVSLTNDLRYGVQWFFQSGTSSLTLSGLASGAVSGVFPGFAAILNKGSDIKVVLTALESVTNVNVLSSPQMMVLNNQTATLQVGDEVPIATQQATSVLTPGAPVVNTIQFRDTGVILRVTPHVNEGGLVQLEISQEVSDVTKTTTSGIDSPTIQQRKFNSTVSVQNGDTIALGGLIRDRRTIGNNGIPLLKDVPLVGNLFKTNSDLDLRTELVVLLTPRVVRSRSDIRGVTDEFRDRLRSIQRSFAP